MEHCWTHRTSPGRRSRWLDLCRFDSGAEPEPWLAVADLDRASLRLFSEEGIADTELVPAGTPWRPCAVTSGVDGTLGVCDWATNALRLIVIDYRPRYERSELLGAKHLHRPYDVAMTTVGNWIVADDEHLVLLDPFGGLIRRISHSVGNGQRWSPRHVTTDSRQRIYVSDPAAGLVTVFDPAGNFLRHLSGVQLRHPCGLLANDLEQLLVADQSRAAVCLFDVYGHYLYDVIGRDMLPRIGDDNLAPDTWRPVALASTTPGQVCLAAAYGEEFVLQCFAYHFMPSTTRSSRS